MEPNHPKTRFWAEQTWRNNNKANLKPILQDSAFYQNETKQ